MKCLKIKKIFNFLTWLKINLLADLKLSNKSVQEFLMNIKSLPKNYKSLKCLFQLLIFSKKTIKTYLKLEIRVNCRKLLTYKYEFIGVFSRNKSNDYLYLNFKSCLKLVFQYTISICISVGRQRILNGYCVDEKYLFYVCI